MCVCVCVSRLQSQHGSPSEKVEFVQKKSDEILGRSPQGRHSGLRPGKYPIGKTLGFSDDVLCTGGNGTQVCAMYMGGWDVCTRYTRGIWEKVY